MVQKMSVSQHGHVVKTQAIATPTCLSKLLLMVICGLVLPSCDGFKFGIARSTPRRDYCAQISSTLDDLQAEMSSLQDQIANAETAADPDPYLPGRLRHVEKQVGEWQDLWTQWECDNIE